MANHLPHHHGRTIVSNEFPLSLKLVDTGSMRIFVVTLLLFLCGCTAIPPSTFPPPTGTPVLVQTPIQVATPEPTTITRGMWLPLFAGAELLVTADGLTAVRHQPDRVLYSGRFEPVPEQAKQVSEWLDEEDQALVAVNCGFYQEQESSFAHMGLLMLNGEGFAKLRAHWGGVLIVRNGQTFIAPRPERLLAPATLGLQGWPMLIQEQRRVARLNDEDLGRRTAIGIDVQGRLVWVVAGNGMTLADFAERLLDPELGLQNAVNLDGGVSSGLRWRATSGAAQVGPDSLPIPCAITLSPLN